jgi:tetratricopeptide (TPR) repeat protein
MKEQSSLRARGTGGGDRLGLAVYAPTVQRHDEHGTAVEAVLFVLAALLAAAGLFLVFARSALDPGASTSTVTTSSTRPPGDARSTTTEQATVPDLLASALRAFSAGKVSFAQTTFETVVRQDPTSKYGWYDLGVIAQGANNLKGAQADYVKALALDPKFESALYNEGLVRFRAGSIIEAIPLLSRAVSLDPDDANAHWALGLVFARMNVPSADSEVIHELSEALKLNPTLSIRAAVPQGPVG